MTPDDVIVMAGRLAADGEPYVLATVVRVRRPASTRPGDRALVRADGSIAGWVGGACAEPVVIRESLRALAAGEPRFVRIGPEGDLDPDGADVVVATTCASEGTVEVLLEPCVAGPLLAVVGDSPAARALSQLAPAVGWRVSRTATAGFVLDALEQALHARRPLDNGLVHHSDRGVQYVSIKYSERLVEAGIEPYGHFGFVRLGRLGHDVLWVKA